ncbi:MAG: glycoside hydrolase family 38 C-terminal domain-containing protein, partial [Planctomycetota bacterium]
LERPAGELWTCPDHPANYDAWDIDRATLANGRRVESQVTCRIEDADTPIPSVVFSRAIGKSSRAEIRYQLVPGETVLRMQIDLDWQDPQTLLKWAAPTNYAGRTARFGAPYGSTLRPQHVGPLENDAMFEVPGSRWAAVADDTERDGLMLVTEAKYGFGCRDGLLHLSLIRSPRYTGHRGEGGGNASANVADRCSDLGPHTARFAVGVYSADAPRAEQPAALADTLFTPPVRVTATPGDAGLRGLEGGDSLVPAWAKPVSDTEPGGWTLRLHETLGRRGAAHLKFAAGHHAQRVDLKGDPLDASPSEADGLRVDFAPYQILSYRITRRGD